MQSKAATVEQYLAELPPERRTALEAVRNVILKNLDKDYEEGMQYGMIGYYVPHRIHPAGYHCDPRQPLPFASLAAQKNHLSLYMMGLYCSCVDGQDSDLLKWFRAAWAKTGRKLDMGRACIRFKGIDDVPLDVIGEAIRRVPVKRCIEFYEAARRTMSTRASSAAARPAKSAQPARPGKRTKGVKSIKSAAVASKKAAKR